MQFIPTDIPDVVLIRPRVFGDHRGEFFEAWNARVFAENGLDYGFVQDNHCDSGPYVLRGLHYQIRMPQGKLVRVTAGEVFDVAVDLRQHADTYGQWVGVTLRAEERTLLWIPPGFAHGYMTLDRGAQFLYKCTDFYAPEHERTIRWDDPDLGIDWPLPEGLDPVVSDRDATGDAFKEAEIYQES